MADKFLQYPVIAASPVVPANADLTTGGQGHERFSKLSVVFTATDLNQADATFSVEARHRGQAWVSISGPTAMTATAGAKSYKAEFSDFLYSEARIVYAHGTVTTGSIKATMLFKD